MPEPSARNPLSRLRAFAWIALFALLALSFLFSAGWLALCAGLALFLFGMQCLEEALRQLAGGRLERLLALSTATPFKSLMFGVTATMLVQSSSLVSLLTIAFLGTGLIQLAAGIAIIPPAPSPRQSGWSCASFSTSVCSRCACSRNSARLKPRCPDSMEVAAAITSRTLPSGRSRSASSSANSRRRWMFRRAVVSKMAQ